MKKFVFVLFSFKAMLAISQVPQAINFQAIARDGNGTLISEKYIGLQLTILDSADGGKAIYQENHGPETNSYGSFALLIGKGNPQVIPDGVDFEDIPWYTGKKYMKVDFETEPKQTFEIPLGVVELATVPYAFSAHSVTNIHDRDAQKGDVLIFDGTNWKPGDTIQHARTTGMINQKKATDGDVLVFDSGKWVPGDTINHSRTTGMIDQTLADTGDVLQFNGSRWVAGREQLKIIKKSRNYKIDPSDDVIFGDISSNNLTLNLPDPAKSNRRLVVKCTGSGKKLKIATFAGSSIYTMAGATVDTVILQQSGNNISLISDGKDFFIHDVNVSVYYHGFDNSKTNAASGTNAPPSLKTEERKYDFVSSNGAIIPPKGLSGLYQVEMHSKMSGASLGQHNHFYLRYSINSSSTITFGYFVAQMTGPAVATAKGSFTVRLKESDSLQVYTNQNSGSTEQIETRLYVARVGD